MKSPQSSKQRVDLLAMKPRFKPQVRNQNRNMKKNIFLRQLTLSRFLTKSRRINEIAMQSFSKKNLSFGIDFKLKVLTLTYKINTHNNSGVRSQIVILTKELQRSITYLCRCKTQSKKLTVTSMGVGNLMSYKF